MRKETWKSTGTAVSNINYHVVWSTKDRRKVLLPPVDETLKEAVAALCGKHGYELLALEITPDHVHVFPESCPGSNRQGIEGFHSPGALGKASGTQKETVGRPSVEPELRRWHGGTGLQRHHQAVH